MHDGLREDNDQRAIRQALPPHHPSRICVRHGGAASPRTSAATRASSSIASTSAGPPQFHSRFGITEIRIQFKRPPHLTFGREAMKEVDPNAITLRIQPEEGISLKFGAKVPADRVVVTSGASGGLLTVAALYVEPADEVLVPDPGPAE